MAKSKESPKDKSESKSERLWRFARNINALGAAAMIGAGVLIPPIAPATTVLGILNVGQAIGSEILRKRSQKSHTRKAEK